MKVSELSEQSGVPISTIKYYIRERVLSTGERSGRNQSSYNETHLRRLKLLTTLRQLLKLPIESIRDILEQVDKPWGAGNPVGTALAAISPLAKTDRSPAEQQKFDSLCNEISTMLLELPWIITDYPNYRELLFVEHIALAVTQIREHIHPEFSVATLKQFADIAWAFSNVAFSGHENRSPKPNDALDDAVSSGLLGILLAEQIVTVLTRSALMMRSFHHSLDRQPPDSQLG